VESRVFIEIELLISSVNKTFDEIPQGGKVEIGKEGVGEGMRKTRAV